MNRRQFLFAIPAAALAGCAPPRASGVVIGSKNFTEQLVLGEMLAQLLAGRLKVPVDSRFYLAGTYICQQSLLGKRIDAYVEYTGTALTAILKEPFQRGADPRAVYQLVKREYGRRFGLEVFPSLGFNNSFAMVVRPEDAQKLSLKTLSDVAKVAPQWRMGAGYEFLERPDGYPGLISTYGWRFRKPPLAMNLALIYTALQNKQVDIVAASNTDGMIRKMNLVVLQDDRGYFPPYDAVPIVRQDTLQQQPEIGTALGSLVGRITADAMREMNYAVDGNHQDAAVVVKQFLKNLAIS
jgi:osmoprotectant transport system substrate-binding protein